MDGEDDDLTLGPDDETQEDEGVEQADETDVEGDGEADDEGESADAEAQGAAEGVAPSRPSRAKTAIAKLREQARASEERAARVEREIADLRAAQHQRQTPPQETPDQEAARLSLMNPEERMDYRLNKALSQHQAATQRQIFEMEDRSDKAEFAAKIRGDAALEKQAAKVEKMLADARARGVNFKREVMLTYAVGEAVLEKRKGVVAAQQQQGKKKIAAQTTRPANARGDQTGQRARRAQTLEEKLANVSI